MPQYPLGVRAVAAALCHALSKPREIASVGESDSADTQVLLNVVRDGYQPFQVVALGAADAPSASAPLLQDRGPVDGQPAAYVCHDFSCQAPATEPEELLAQL